MKMTKQSNWENMRDKDKNYFALAWIRANSHNVNIHIEDTGNNMVNVEAFDKKSNTLVCRAQVDDKESTEFELYANKDLKKPFDIQTVIKPGEMVYIINPVFECSGDKMFMREENIIHLRVTEVSGASDLDIIVRGIGTDFEYYAVVQQAVFMELQDAVEACERTPKGGYANWDEYKEAVRDLVSYNYALEVNVQYGENMAITAADKIFSVEKESNAKNIIRTVRAKRVVFVCKDDTIDTTVQMTPWLSYDSETWVDANDTTNEVIITMGDTGVSRAELNEQRVYRLVPQYKAEATMEFMGKRNVVITPRTMRILKARIEAKQTQLSKEISSACNTNDTETVAHLKNLMAQCNAESRLLYHLENKDDPEKFMVC